MEVTTSPSPYTFFSFDDWAKLTNEVMTSLFLYGKTTPPADLNDRVKDLSRNVTVTLDAANFMSTGPGRYANPSQVPFVQTLFGPGEDLSNWMQKWGITDTKSWTVKELKSLILSKGGTPGDFFSHVLQQYRLDAGSPDYALRTYIYNTGKFDLSDSTVIDFNTSKPGVPPDMRNISFVPEDDNFDFIGGGTGDGGITQLGNDVVLKPAIDPQELGKKVEIAFSQNSLRNIPVKNVEVAYGPDDFSRDSQAYQKILLSPNVGVAYALPAMLGVIADLTATKTIEYDRDSWNIIYGSAGDDVLNASSDRSNDILVGGPGNDLLVGNDLANILIAGSGDDTLKGGAGFDQYVLTSDGGKDTIYDNDGRGSISIDGNVYGGGTALVNGEPFTWIDDNDGKTQYQFTKGVGNPNVGTLTITGGVLGTGQVIINNFDLNRAETDANGYLGIKFKEKIASAAGTNRNPQYHRDALGNLIADPHSPTPGRDDTPFGSSGNDLMNAGGGNNQIYAAQAGAAQGGNDTIGLGNGNHIVKTGNGASRVSVGDGSNQVGLGGGDNTVSAGAGANIIRGNDAVSVGNGSNTIGVGSADGSTNTIQVGDGNNTIAVAAGTNDIRVGNGTDTVQTGNGVNTIHLGAGQVTLTNYGGQDTATFASTVQDDQLWFAQDGNDLLVTVDGTSSNLRLTDWFNGATHATLVAGDGHQLIDSQVASLVQAMAQFSPPSAGQTTLLQPQQDSLAPVIAASWR
ncbi:calcium-binding protein [Ralstonia syzygii]|uniref:calcium-binding protein n=1 Tax=Ralstonia syzygii TaxID=28097 RepID=UPI0018D1D846|nr:calcium-binding protein [Ralstonia syzygii]